MSFATKLNHVVYVDGSAHDVMKHPLTDMGKISLPGETSFAHVIASKFAEGCGCTATWTKNRSLETIAIPAARVRKGQECLLDTQG
jgi:hypothetical protein